MTYDEFLETEERWVATQVNRLLYLEVQNDQLQVFQILEDRPKSFCLTLLSRPILYRGQDFFWIPKFFISNNADKNPDFKGILRLNYFFKDMWEAQLKVNLTLRYNM
jgi:hypothetical protein